jgi:hypothetical protein
VLTENAKPRRRFSPALKGVIIITGQARGAAITASGSLTQPQCQPRAQVDQKSPEHGNPSTVFSAMAQGALIKRSQQMIHIQQNWLATEPVDMRAGAETLLGRVVKVFGQAERHQA